MKKAPPQGAKKLYGGVYTPAPERMETRRLPLKLAVLDGKYNIWLYNLLRG